MVPPGAPQPPRALQLRVGSPCGPSPPAPLWLCSMKGNLVASWGCVWVSLGRCSSKLGETPGEERSTWPLCGSCGDGKLVLASLGLQVRAES